MKLSVDPDIIWLAVVIFLGLVILIICVILGISVGNFFRFVYTHNLCEFRDKCW